MTDQTKLAAQANFQELSNQVGQITEKLEQDFQNNTFNIKIDAPTLVIPFKQKTWEDIYQSECWVFTMGDVSLISFTGEGFEKITHEAFKLKVERVKFEHASKYCMWKQMISLGIDLTDTNSMASAPPSPLLMTQHSDLSATTPEKRVKFQNLILGKSKVLRTTKILEDFSTSVLLLKKRNQVEMRTPEMLEQLMSDRSPSIMVQAKLDDEIQLSLRPAVF